MPSRRNSSRSRSRRNSDNGSSYYYVNGEKVPVTHLDDLVAIVYNSRAQLDEVAAIAEGRSKKLEPTDEFPAMQEGRMRIYRVDDPTAESTVELRQEIQPDPAVDKVGAVFRNEHDQPMVLTDEIVCKFKPELTEAQIEEIKNTYHLQTVTPLGFSENAFILRVETAADQNALEIANDLVEKGYAVHCAPNWIEHIGVRRSPAALLEATEVRHGIHPTDPNFNQQWHHENTGQAGGTAGADVRTPLAWQSTLGDPNVRVAVIDVGIDITHTDLNQPGKVVAPIDFTVMPPDNNPLGGSHGTEVSGMAVGAANNGCAGCGTAPNCRLIAIRAPDVGPQVQMAFGFAYAADQGADVITSSLGPVGPWIMQDILRDAINYATTFGRNGRGCVFTQAVDNTTNPVAMDQVSAYERSIAVSRTDNRDLYDGTATSLPATPNQNTGPAMGPELDLCAPGRNVFTITNTTSTNACTTRSVSGTSYATPLTAGVAALVISTNPGLSWEEVRQVLLDSADKIDATAFPYTAAPAGRPPGTRNDRYGYGRVNAERAVQMAAAASPRDLYIRDTLLDLGTVPQPNYGFWDSPDIWVRNTDDGGTDHQETIRGQDNVLHARISNRGTQASLPCWVRFLITTFAGSQFRYPFDYKLDTTVSPGGGTTGNLRPASQFPNPGSYLVGVQRIESIPAGGSAIAKVLWPASLIPPATNWHPCLLVEVSPHDGPTAAGVHVWENNNLGQKNVTIVNVSRGQLLEIPFRFGHPELVEQMVTLNVAKLQPASDWKLYLDLQQPQLIESIVANAALTTTGQIVQPNGGRGVNSAGIVNNPDIAALSTGIGTLPLSGNLPFKMTFLSETRIALSRGDTRAEDLSLVVTFPPNSVLEIGAAPLGDVLSPQPGDNVINPQIPGTIPGGDTFPGVVQPQRPAFTVADLQGTSVLALDPALQLARIDIPLAEVKVHDSLLKLQVPESARSGESLTLDVAETTAAGELVGGVRVHVNVIG